MVGGGGVKIGQIRATKYVDYPYPLLFASTTCSYVARLIPGPRSLHAAEASEYGVNQFPIGGTYTKIPKTVPIQILLHIKVATKPGYLPLTYIALIAQFGEEQLG